MIAINAGMNMRAILAEERFLLFDGRVAMRAFLVRVGR